MIYQINDSNYEYHIRLENTITGQISVKFLTKYRDARDPDQFQEKFQMLLSPEELSGLGSFINHYVISHT